MDMRQLLYVSNAARDIPASDLDDILTEARARNAGRGLSGILIHVDGGFLQILEGARETVMQVYGRIAQDKRHSHPHVLVDRETQVPAFAAWSMGYEHLTGAKDEMAGMFGIVREAIAGHLSPGAGRVVATMLETFYRLEMGAPFEAPKGIVRPSLEMLTAR
jgi:Sensors of blue-light using FAD